MKLRVNDVCVQSVSSLKEWTNTSIDVIQGEVYDFRASAIWSDYYIPVNANGYKGEWVKKSKYKRLLHENRFALIGNIDKGNDASFLIGKNRRRCIITKSGRLYCFANDIKREKETLFLFSNWSAVKLFIKRVG